jgi:hypothetical protein
MKKIISVARAMVLTLSALTFTSLILTSCFKDKNNDTSNTPVAGLMAFNLAPGSSVAFSLSGSVLNNNPLSYTAYTGGYLSIYPGQRSVEAFDSYSNRGSAIAAVDGNFEVDKYYSVFLVGADSSFKNILVADNIDSLSASSGKAFIRYVNAIPDSLTPPTVTVTAGGSNIVNAPALFAGVSEFVGVTPGEINITVKNSAGIDAGRTITVEQKKVYTILLTGIPGSSTTPVEIKYITNGLLDDEAAAVGATGLGAGSAID